MEDDPLDILVGKIRFQPVEIPWRITWQAKHGNRVRHERFLLVLLRILLRMRPNQFIGPVGFLRKIRKTFTMPFVFRSIADGPPADSVPVSASNPASSKSSGGFLSGFELLRGTVFRLESCSRCHRFSAWRFPRRLIPTRSQD